MNDGTVLSVKIDKSLNGRLAKLADAIKCSPSFLAAEAIEVFVTIQERQITGIQDALASLDRGEGIAHEDVKAWVKTL